MAALLSASPSSTGAREPLCDWLDGLGAAAQARSDGLPDAHLRARGALAALSTGDAGTRAGLEVALALRGPETVQERVRTLRAVAAAAPPVTRATILALLGEALLESGDPRGAVEPLRAASAEGSSAVAARARWRVADALHAGGFAEEAVAAWRPLLADPLASNFEPSARLAFASDLLSAGEPDLAARILRSLWSALPERAEASLAEALLDRRRADGAAIPPFAGEERVARALRLVSVGRAGEAVIELKRAESSLPAAPAGLLALAEGTAQLALGHPAEAARLVGPHAASEDAGVRRGAQVILARAAAKAGRIPEAIEAWRAVAVSRAEVPGLTPQLQASLRDDAEYFAAWLNFEAGDPQRASAALGRLARLRPRSRRADDARWFSAWALLQLGEVGRADAALRVADRGQLRTRARYWRARIARDDGVAGSLLRSVVAADPLGYYGLLACGRLRAKGVACEPPPLGDGPPFPELEDQPDAARLRQAAALAAAGLRDEAMEELRAIASSRGGRRAAPLVAELAAFLGDTLLPFRLSRDQLGLSRRTLDWSFPDVWPAIVHPAARAAGVDPTLLRAVMRRESGFRRDARSSAGAIGLLQIIPGTAARLAALLRLPEPLSDRLEEPEVNVPLGAGYLGLLLQRFGEPLVAIAAYNAGPGAVTRWGQDRKALPLDAWVESIPYRETRQYVRAVVENWAGARAAAGEPRLEIDPGRLVGPPAPGVMF